MTAAVELTVSEILEALATARANPDAADARTKTDLIEATGLSRERITAALRAYQQAGRLTVHMIYREAIDGTMRRVPAYVITAKPKRSR